MAHVCAQPVPIHSLLVYHCGAHEARLETVQAPVRIPGREENLRTGTHAHNACAPLASVGPTVSGAIRARPLLYTYDGSMGFSMCLVARCELCTRCSAYHPTHGLASLWWNVAGCQDARGDVSPGKQVPTMPSSKVLPGQLAWRLQRGPRDQGWPRTPSA